MKLWLCLGNERTSKCIHADIKVQTSDKPQWRESTQFDREQTWKSLLIFCKFHDKYMFEFVTHCNGYYNTTLGEY